MEQVHFGICGLGQLDPTETKNIVTYPHLIARITMLVKRATVGDYQYSDVIMGTMASQITSLTIVY